MDNDRGKLRHMGDCNEVKNNDGSITINISFPTFNELIKELSKRPDPRSGQMYLTL